MISNHRVRKFRPDGPFLDGFGEEGAGPGEFRYPVGLAVAPMAPSSPLAAAGRHVKRWLTMTSELPELNLAFFSFLLHFVWEMWQVPFFAGMPSTSHWSGVGICTQATFGDAAMAVTGFWTAALVRRSRQWFRNPRPSEWTAYLAVGLVLTVAFEWLATGPLERWSYGPEMPRIPVLGTGLLPVLQWVVVPPLALAITARQLKGMPSGT